MRTRLSKDRRARTTTTRPDLPRPTAPASTRSIPARGGTVGHPARRITAAPEPPSSSPGAPASPGSGRGSPAHIGWAPFVARPVRGLLAVVFAVGLIWVLRELFQPFHGSGHGEVMVRVPPHASCESGRHPARPRRRHLVELLLRAPGDAVRRPRRPALRRVPIQPTRATARRSASHQGAAGGEGLEHHDRPRAGPATRSTRCCAPRG